MKDLTLDEAKRYARACGWLRDEPDGVVFYSYEFVATWPRADTNEWVPESCLSRDPYFWFPRLWDRLEDKIMEPEDPTEGDVSLFPFVMEFKPTSWHESDPIVKKYTIHSPSAGPVGFGAGVKVYGEANHPCLALCAAIEALEAE